MNVFWWAKTGDKAGMYAIGLGNTEVAVITAPDDTLAAQWAQCCANALNERERHLNKFAEQEERAKHGLTPGDVIYRGDGTIDYEASAARQALRDKWEANAD